MHVEKTHVKSTEIKIIITASEVELEPIKNSTLKRLAKNIKVAGFREGKVPLQIAEKHLEPNTYQAEFLDEALTTLYAEATTQEKIRPTSSPEVNILKFVPFTELEFEVTTEVIGEIKLGSYKGLKLKVEKKKVTAKDISEVLDRVALQMSERKEVDRAAKSGDEVHMDFRGVDSKGEPINGADGKDYPLILGSNSFIPGFEDNMIGMKSGDEKSFELTFPKDYGVKALASKKVTFTVNAKKINEMVVPKIDDELAQKVGPFKTVDDLKKDISKQLEFEAEQGFVRDQQNEAVRMLSESSTVELPDQLVEQQVVFETDELRRNLTYRGQTYQEFLEAEGKSEDEYKKEVIAPRASEQLKISILLSEIAEKEGLSITAEELQAQLQALRAEYSDPSMQQQLDKPENQRDIASRMLSQKVVNFMVENQAK